MTDIYRHNQLPALDHPQERQVVDEFRRVERWSQRVNDRLVALEGGGGGGIVGAGGEAFNNDVGTEYGVLATLNNWVGISLRGVALTGNRNVAKSSNRWSPTQNPTLLKAYAFIEFDVQGVASPTYDAWDFGIYKNTTANHVGGYGLYITSDNWQISGTGFRTVSATQKIIDLLPSISDEYGLSIRSTQRQTTLTVRSCNFWIEYE